LGPIYTCRLDWNL